MELQVGCSGGICAEQRSRLPTGCARDTGVRELYNSYQKSLTNRERGKGGAAGRKEIKSSNTGQAAAEKKRTMPLDIHNMDMSPAEMWNKVLLTVQGAVGDVEPTEALLALAVGYAFFKLVHLVVTSPSIPKSVWVPLEPGETTTVGGTKLYCCTDWCCPSH